jgi:hypothetical protein
MHTRMARIAMIFAAPLIVAGCNGVIADRPAAPDLKLKTGIYKIEARQGQKAVWHDAAVIGESQAGTFLENILRVFQGRMAPSNGASSYQAKDRPCEINSFEPAGGKFTATGECRIESEGETTSFTYHGTSFGDGFSINVERSGFDTRTPGKPDKIVISGTWERAIEKQQSEAAVSVPDDSSYEQSYEYEERDTTSEEADTSSEEAETSDNSEL